MYDRQLFMFLEPATDPARDRTTVDSDGIETVSIWVPDAAAAAAVAAAEAAAGVDIIELYRGFDLGTAAGVLAAADGRAPVGFATYLHGIQRTGAIVRSATIFKADPVQQEPIVRQHSRGGSTTIVGSSDAATTVVLARQFADDGVDLIEICGGESLTTAAEVHAALHDRVPVSYVVYPYDSLESAAAYKASFATAD